MEKRKQRRNTRAMSAGNIEMEKLIPIVNKLHDVCREMGTTVAFDLPQIAVIGAQSAGKSSVLENIVGRDFLPRGSGIVTRRPLILQLINGQTEYGEFGHLTGDKYKKFVNFNDIRAEIEAETDRITGSNRGISKDPISLRIYSPNVLDLTLIDLPGLTKVPVGDQPADIEKLIRDMILEFIRKENCLILAVSPANYDLANSDALNMAKEVDEGGLRTIGVITKLDLMDQGTNARDIFMGKLLKLRRGYVGVVNRSQMDIDNKKDIEVTLQAERDFFNNHSAYKDIANRLGTTYLQKVLNEQLTQHIAKTLESVREKTRDKMDILRKEIDTFESLHPDDLSSMKEIVINVIQRIQKDFDMEMGSLGSTDVHIDRLCGGAKIRRIFDEGLPGLISKISHEGDDMCDEIANAIDNAYGYRGIMNTPSITLVSHIKKQIERLRSPIEKTIALVGEELKKAVRKSTEGISSYPKFRAYIESDIMSNLHKNLSSNQQNVLSLVQMQKAYTNSGHFAIKNRDNGFIREGILTLQEKQNREYRFVLKSTELICSDVKDGTVVFTAQLVGARFQLIRENDYDIASKQKIVILKPPQPLFQAMNPQITYSQLTLSSSKLVDIRLWIKSFLQVKMQLDGKYVLDPLQEKVDDAYEDILQYMNIVKKTMCDLTPKAITLYVIQGLEKFIKTDLLIKYGTSDDKMLSMFGADNEEVAKYKENQVMYETCEKALEVLDKSPVEM